MSPASTNTVILLVLLALVVGSIIIWRRWGRPSASPKPTVAPPVPPTTPPAATGAPAPTAAAPTPAAPAAATPSPATASSSGFDWGALGRGIRLVVFWLVGIAIAIAVVGFVTTYNAWPITIAVLVLLAAIGIPSYFGGKKLFKGAGGMISITIFIVAMFFITWGAWDVITRGPGATWASLQGLGQVYSRFINNSDAATRPSMPPALNASARVMGWTEATAIAFTPLPRERGCLYWTVDTPTFDAIKSRLPGDPRSHFGWEPRHGGTGPKPSPQLVAAMAGRSSVSAFVQTRPCPSR